MAEQNTDDLFVTNKIKIKAVPKTKPDEKEHFELIKGEKLPQLEENDLLIELEYLSVDPYQRGRMALWYKAKDKDMISFGVAKVLKSKDAKFKEGAYIYGVFPWATRQIVSTKPKDVSSKPKDVSMDHKLNKTAARILGAVPAFGLDKYKPKEDKDYNADLDDAESKFDYDQIKKIPHSYYIGSYGMPGGTAYYGMLYKGKVKKGENVLISGAAGAVGSICGQIAKAVYGCHTIGIAGSPEKIKWLTDDLGFDGAINYKEYGNDYDKVQAALKEKFPNGIDLYFDNVGGVFSEAVYDLLNPKARVIICGQIASYNDDPSKPAMIRPFLHKIIYKEIEIKGIIYTEFKNHAKFYYDMGRWISTGKIKIKETVIDGFEKTPEAFCGLFKGINIGKLVVKCS